MKIETTIQEDHQAKLIVEVEADAMEDMKRRAARKIARRVRIPGFRPGKAPYQVVIRQLGEGAIIEEALEMLVDDIYPKIIDEADIKPYGPGMLKDVVSMEPPVLEFLVPLDAEVTLGDYRSLRRPYEPSVVTDEDVDEVLENLRERQAVIEPVERPAEEGDLVTVRLGASRIQVDEDHDPVLIHEQSVPVIVKPSDPEDSSHEIDADEWPFPGFSAKLIGLSAGDEKTLRHVFPEDVENEAFQGVEADINFVVETVKERNLPPVDDDFASSMGDYEDLDALKVAIRTNLERQKQQSYDESYDDEIIEAAVEQTAFKYPPQMLESEKDEIIHDLTHRLEQQGLDMDLYLKTQDLDMDGLKEEINPVAERRLKRSLFLYELAQAENIEIETDEVKEEADHTVNYLSQVLPKDEARKLSNKDVYSNLVRNIMVDMLSRKSMERFRAICKGELEEQAELIEQAEEELEVEVSNGVEQVDDQVLEVEAGDMLTAEAESSQGETEVQSAPEAEQQPSEDVNSETEQESEVE